MYECRVTRNPDPRPAAGKDIPVSAFVLPNTAPLGPVQLTYLVNYGTPTTIPMTAAAGMLLISISVVHWSCLQAMHHGWVMSLFHIWYKCGLGTLPCSLCLHLPWWLDTDAYM